MAKTSIVTRYLESTSHLLSMDPRIAPRERAAFRTDAHAKMAQMMEAFFGGERVYGPRLAAITRAQRNERIRAAAGAGECSTSIAKRERVSVRQVRRICRGQTRP